MNSSYFSFFLSLSSSLNENAFILSRSLSLSLALSCCLSQTRRLSTIQVSVTSISLFVCYLKDFSLCRCVCIALHFLFVVVFYSHCIHHCQSIGFIPRYISFTLVLVLKVVLYFVILPLELNYITVSKCWKNFW